MVAELLRLRLRTLAGSFRRPPRQLAGLIVALVLAVAGVAAFWAGAEWVSRFDDAFVYRSTTVLGSWLSLAAFLVPLMLVRREALSPRAFLGYPISASGAVVTVLVYSLIGPGILLLPMAFAPVVAWHADPGAQQLAWAAVPLLFMVSLVSVQLGRRLGVAVRRRPGLGVWVNTLGTVVLLVGAALSLVTVAGRVPQLRWLVTLTEPIDGILKRIPDALAVTPFGVLWAAPEYAASTVGEAATAWQMLGFAALLVIVLVVAWVAVVAWPLNATRRTPRARRIRVPGFFASVPANPAGAVAARSMTYWMRDPRYRTVFAVLPVVLVLTLVALAIGGVPFSISVLVPLPLMTLLLAWSTTHNDVAYDGTAMWQHVVAQTPGVADRRGRTMPVLVMGALLLVVGIPLTVWVHGDLSIAAPFTGVCVALLFGGVGIGSLYSARFPYVAPRPGDPAWQSPQSTTSRGGAAQGVSVLLVVATALPALALGAVWWILGGTWGWAALGAGVLVGAAVLAAGIASGGRHFDRRAPELLEFTLRT